MQRKQFLRYMGAALGWVAIAPLLTGCNSDETSTETSTAPVDSTTTTTTDTSTTTDTTTDTTTTPDTSTSSTLSAEEIAALKFMREEEKLAHDVYVALYATWGNNVFSQIALSETSHTEAILALLIRYGLDDPAAGKAAGVYEDPALQSLYNALIIQGASSEIAALSVGALIEETDIHDIHAKQAITDEADILTTYASLLCGSQNHLRAFNSKLLALGITYVPQVITQAEWDAIVASPDGACIP